MLNAITPYQQQLHFGKCILLGHLNGCKYTHTSDALTHISSLTIWLRDMHIMDR